MFIFICICTCKPTNSKSYAMFYYTSVSLLHCFHLQFFNGKTRGTIAFQKSRLGEKLLAFLSVLLSI